MQIVFAYIDPGSGSLMIQALIAGMVAVPIFFRHQIARAISAFRRTPEESKPAAPAAAPATTPTEDDARPGA